MTTDENLRVQDRVEVNSESTPDIPTSVTPESSQRNQKLVRLGLLGLLVVLLVAMVSLSSTLRTILLAEDFEGRSVIERISDYLPSFLTNSDDEPNEVSTDEPLFHREWFVLHRVENDSVATVAAIPVDRPHVALWHDYLLYAEESATEGAVVKSTHLPTLQTEVLFKEIDEFAGHRLDRIEVTSFDVVNDALLFGMGGYMLDGAQFGIDLAEKKVHTIASVMSGSFITNWANRVWIRGGFADGCTSEIELYTVNVSNWKTRPVAKLNGGCTNGDEVVGIDQQGRLLMAGYTADGIEAPQKNRTYNYIQAIHVDNPEIYEGIIATQDMSKDIRRIHLDADTNSLVLTSDSDSIIYSLDTKTSSTAAELVPPTQSDYDTALRHADLKTKVEAMSLPDGFEWVMETR